MPTSHSTTPQSLPDSNNDLDGANAEPMTDGRHDTRMNDEEKARGISPKVIYTPRYVFLVLSLFSTINKKFRFYTKLLQRNTRQDNKTTTTDEE